MTDLLGLCRTYPVSSLWLSGTEERKVQSKVFCVCVLLQTSLRWLQNSTDNTPYYCIWSGTSESASFAKCKRMQLCLHSNDSILWCPQLPNYHWGKRYSDFNNSDLFVVCFRWVSFLKVKKPRKLCVTACHTAWLSIQLWPTGQRTVTKSIKTPNKEFL